MTAHRVSLRAKSIVVVLSLASLALGSAHGENRSMDGVGNNLSAPLAGSAGQPLMRMGSTAYYPDGTGDRMLNDAERANPRDVSNRISSQPASVASRRGLTDFIWAWGQFLDHDIDLSTASNGPTINGTAHIAVNDPADLLGPNPIPFTRSNFQQDATTQFIRTQFNEVTSFVDASQVYGSDAARAAALRANGGLGAKLEMSAGGLPMFNSIGLPNDNVGPTPDEDLFLAGDIRANENVLLTSMHTLFAREHNRLVDVIAVEQPSLNAEEQYHLARKIVGAEIQIVTYGEFLPALLGGLAPAASSYAYDSAVPPAIAQEFAHAAYRFGHSMVSSHLELVNDDGSSDPSLPLRHAFANPGFLAADPGRVDQLLRGAATSLSEEVDAMVIDDLRNFLFGPPGMGGLDLAALNIQRGRDHGLPDYNRLRIDYGLTAYTAFDQITSDASLQMSLEEAYDDDINNVDAWVGMLAEDHVPGTSVGELLGAIITNQFERLRDGDRMFYLSDELGLYQNGEVDASIASIIDLNNLQLSDVIRMNTTITNIQDNVFFLVPEPAGIALVLAGLAASCFARRRATL